MASKNACAAAASSRSTANKVLAVLLKGGANPEAAAGAQLLEKKTPLILWRGSESCQRRAPISTDPTRLAATG